MLQISPTRTEVKSVQLHMEYLNIICSVFSFGEKTHNFRHCLYEAVGSNTRKDVYKIRSCSCIVSEKLDLGRGTRKNKDGCRTTQNL